MNRTLKIGIIAALLVYGCGILYTYYSNIKFKEQIAFYDLDKNGTIENEELTKNAIKTVKQIEKRKTVKQAYIMLIPLSLILGIAVAAMGFLFRKMKRINDNEIHYGGQD